ncbi:hypothetical protein [Pseudomonas sp. WSY_20]|uniref:hypothetical protein n=1 Tax=Pseudomonas sp. WSY_20 TaxID=3367212 RepID=UPI003709CE9E
MGVLHHGEVSHAEAWEFIITIPGGFVINRNWQEYDQAEWLLSLAVGKYAALIGAERRMPAPDQGKIDDWLEKQAAAADLLDDLDLFEREEVSDLLAKLKEED